MVELGITGLPDTPKRASATIEVRSDSGKSVILDVGRAKRDCWSKGDVSWHQQKLTEAVALGGKSFTYVVRVDLDGETYTGTARWPEDTNEQITPGVPLTWDPPLPAYDGSKALVRDVDDLERLAHHRHVRSELPVVRLVLGEEAFVHLAPVGERRIALPSARACSSVTASKATTCTRIICAMTPPDDRGRPARC